MMDIKLMPDKYKSSSSKKSGFGLSKIGLSGGLTNLLYGLLISLLILVVLISFGLWGYKISLDKNKEELSNEIAELQNLRDSDLEKSLEELKVTIEDLKSILNKRKYSSNIFAMLEELTLEKVYFDSFNADISKSLVLLGIRAADYNIMAKQIEVFKQDSRIAQIEFSDARLETEGWISSNLEINLSNDFLYSN